MENVIEVKELSKKYKDFELKDINLSLQKGMIMGFIGENGAGKTTTIKAILNLINPTSGEIKIFELDNKKEEEKIKEDIGVVLDISIIITMSFVSLIVGIFSAPKMTENISETTKILMPILFSLGTMIIYYISYKVSCIIYSKSEQ